MTTPPPADKGFVDGHADLDERLAAAFRRYDAAFGHRSPRPDPELVQARMDLSLLLWSEDDVPEQVEQQLTLDGEQLLRDTPPL